MKNKVLLTVVSRGRPDFAKEFVKLWRKYSVMTDLIFVVDKDDKTIKDYPKPSKNFSVYVVDPGTHLGEGRNIGFGLNQDYKYYSFLDDDHRIKTKAWDNKMIEKLEKEGGIGLVYANDLLQEEKIPNVTIISGNILKTMSYAIPPGLKHLKHESIFKELAQAVNCYHYMPEIIVEHIHPANQKREWDEQTKKMNSPERITKDGSVFDRWREHELPKIVKELKKT